MIEETNRTLTTDSNDVKRRYVRMSWPGAGVGSCIVEPQDVDDMEAGACARAVYEDVWMTPAEYAALPEFES